MLRHTKASDMGAPDNAVAIAEARPALPILRDFEARDLS
jgi:hypothetical protein